MGSKNGTYINRQRICGEVMLHAGDRVKIANVLLEWQQYFPTPVRSQPKPSNSWRWIVGTAATAAILLVAGLSFLNREQVAGRNIVFEGKYPPVKTIAYTENGKEYEIEAYSGQIVMFFQSNMSYSKEIISQNGGKIISQIPAMQYFLVEVGKGNENIFLQNVKTNSAVSYAFLHMPEYPCSANLHIIDNTEYEQDGHIHGQIVSASAMACCESCTFANEHNIAVKGEDHKIANLDGIHDRTFFSYTNNELIIDDKSNTAPWGREYIANRVFKRIK
jgi:hypothetical protein